LIVKDACNSPVTLSTSLNLSFNSPTAPGLFIFAQTSAAKGAAIGDPRLDGVTYLATNANAFVVDAQYAFGNFQINSTMKYNVSTSTPFGMQIQVRGIKDNVKLSSLQGGFDMTSASIRAVTYSTDEAGDHSVAVSLKGSNCTLSGQAAVVTFVPGSPCPNGYTGDQNKATVNISGHFSCIDVSDNSQSINIDGDFSGSTAMADFCAVVITAHSHL
jgi:hypothetical protein